MPDPDRRPWACLCALVIALVVIGTGCTAPSAPGPDPSGTVQVSYAGADGWLATLEPQEAGQQVLDWARLGLASALRMPSGRVADALYDQPVVRTSTIDGLVDQRASPGRALDDGTTLHLIVPDDEAAARATVHDLLDQFRADRGTDPAQVQLHRYTIDGAARSVTLVGEPVTPTAVVRTDAGWVSSPVPDQGALAAFLSRTDRLSRLEVRDGQVWAEGWDDPDRDGTITPDDLAALQRGYLGSSGPPGFSLDPGTVTTAADLRAAVPGLEPRLADAIVSGSYAGTSFGSLDALRQAVDDVLFRGAPAAAGLPADRTALWALRGRLFGGPVYTQARYGGGLAGTEAGMTLFYTDHTAKNWTFGVGSGVPFGPVPGFVPNDRAHTPAGLCPAPSDQQTTSGRLWFGQDDTAFAYSATGVGIGPRSTRLYFRADANGSETEPDYQFGRSLSWWDRNYAAVAVYEPQYARLDQLMRWSGALEWLTLNQRLLPVPAEPAPASSPTFADWYAAHPELRERGPLALVAPPSARGEALIAPPSPAFEDCGMTQIYGGVSLGDGLARRGGVPEYVPLPPPLQRARAADASGTRIDPATGDGRITRSTPQTPSSVGERITYSLVHGTERSRVSVTGGPASSIRAGDGRLVADGARSQGVTFRSDGNRLSADVAVQGSPLASVVAEVTGPGVSVSLRPGVGELFTRLLPRWGERAAPTPATVPELRWQYGDGAGRVSFAADDGTGGWFREGPPSATFQAGLTAEIRGPDGTVRTVVAGTPAELTRTDAANVETTQDPPVTTTWGALADRVPPGVPVFVAAPPSGPRSAPPPTARVVFEVAGRNPSPVPSGAVPTTPGIGFGRWSRVDLPAVAGAGAVGATGTGGAPGGPAGDPGAGFTAPPGWYVVVVYDCDDDRQEARQDPRRRQECDR